IKGQLLEELLVSRMGDKAAREATAGAKAVQAAKEAKGEIDFIPGHLIRDAEGQMFTDGVLAYRDGNRWHVVTIFESKAGKPSAQKLKRAWKDIPRPADLAEKQTWQRMSGKQLEKLRQTDPGLARKIESWRDVRMEAIEELRETNPALANKPSTFIEQKH